MKKKVNRKPEPRNTKTHIKGSTQVCKLISTNDRMLVRIEFSGKYCLRTKKRHIERKFEQNKANHEQKSLSHVN